MFGKREQDTVCANSDIFKEHPEWGVPFDTNQTHRVWDVSRCALTHNISDGSDDGNRVAATSLLHWRWIQKGQGPVQNFVCKLEYRTSTHLEHWISRINSCLRWHAKKHPVLSSAFLHFPGTPQRMTQKWAVIRCTEIFIALCGSIEFSAVVKCSLSAPDEVNGCRNNSEPQISNRKSGSGWVCFQVCWKTAKIFCLWCVCVCERGKCGGRLKQQRHSSPVHSSKAGVQFGTSCQCRFWPSRSKRTRLSRFHPPCIPDHLEAKKCPSFRKATVCCIFGPSAAMSRDGLMESGTSHRCWHGDPPAPNTQLTPQGWPTAPSTHSTDHPPTLLDHMVGI